MNDPFNQLPTPPEFVRKLDEVGKHAREVLGCSVVLIAAQENGKLAVCIEAEEGSAFAELLDKVGASVLLQSLGWMVGVQDAQGAAGPQS